jgi:phosphoserine phosphatase
MKHNREKQRVCLTSWDGTLRQGYTLRDWLLYLYMNSKISHFGHADVSFHAQRYNEGEITYESFLQESYDIHSQCLIGKFYNEIASGTEDFVNKNLYPSLSDFSYDLLTQVKQKDIEIIVIYGGPSLPLKFQTVFPLHMIYATEIEVSNTGVFTGRILSKYGHYLDKVDIIKKLNEAYDIVLAFGNSLADMPMLQHADHSFIKLNSTSPYFTSITSQPNIRELTPETLQYISRTL